MALSSPVDAWWMWVCGHVSDDEEVVDNAAGSVAAAFICGAWVLTSVSSAMTSKLSPDEDACVVTAVES